MKERRIYDRETLVLPDHLADWDVWEYWEKPRTDSIIANYQPGRVLYDVGAEHGALSALYARAGWGMVLVEPSAEFWPNIRMTWQANGLPDPLACRQALLGAHPDAAIQEGPSMPDSPWPTCAASDEECPARPYRYLHEPSHVAATPVLTLDAIATAGPAPDGVTIDVEGAEMEVLRGGQRVLSGCRPLVWVSVHPDLMARDYACTPDDVHTLMRDYNYRSAHLATDHEEHHLFWPAERTDVARP